MCFYTFIDISLTATADCAWISWTETTTNPAVRSLWGTECVVGFKQHPTLSYLLNYQGALPETNFASLALCFSSAPINWEIKRVNSGIKELLRQMENWKRTWKINQKKDLKFSLNHSFDTMMIRGLFVPWKAEFFSPLLRSKAEAAKQRVSKRGMKCHHENTAVMHR